MVLHTDLAVEDTGEIDQQLRRSEADVLSNGGMMSNDQRPASADTTLPKHPISPTKIADKRCNRKIRLKPSKLSPITISIPDTGSYTAAIETHVRKLVGNLKGTSLETIREAAFELRLLAKDEDNRILIANCDGINSLIHLLRSPDLMIQEHAVTAILNLSISDNNKILIANFDAIEPLIHVVQKGTPEARENTAATLSSLCKFEKVNIQIGNSGAIGPLVELLGNGSPHGKKDAATALFHLSTMTENKLGIAKSGAVKHLIDLMDPAIGLVDRATVVLANIATIPEGRSAIAQEGGIPLLVEAIELGSQRVKENAAAALWLFCSDSKSNKYCRRLLEEGAAPPLVALSTSGTARAREKATKILNHLRNLPRYGRRG
ncbi:U-box domain-containing protein 4-like [Silene latifolia]|uniref:U-box domain-containing protein 4-like n=1 Tax=Silene latifolia TaxID=37657 RepID=UPI003D782D24